MPRPVRANAAETKERILAAALCAFSERGRDGASVRAIASAGGVSLAMVNHYFGSKDGLYEACIDRMYGDLGRMRGALDSELRGAADLERLIEDAVRTGFRFARKNQITVRLLFREIAARGELDESRRENHQRPFLDSATAALGNILGRDPRSLRMPVQSAVALVGRYAMSSDTELALFTGDDRDPVGTTEDHLVVAARALLAP